MGGSTAPKRKPKAGANQPDNQRPVVALDGRADVIVGDADLAMHPWRGIVILSPTVYLKADN